MHPVEKRIDQLPKQSPPISPPLFDWLPSLEGSAAIKSGEVARKAFDTGLEWVIAIIVNGLAFTICIAIVFTRSIVLPMQSLLKVNQKIAEGEFAQRCGSVRRR
ncbi:methyl-accepting chemotaxis protein [Pseudomonas sp. C1C7]|uniref:HAMP domain-containing protein n=1 Tax=Pseudomonas sp. C1C7 TaxID=2735272 RepID=UPI001586DFAF|nr:methyl-accepting chemotaxis protein [Pseudomonas sp. C1C7]NUT76691.1 methyl-accepting chemotaxis protein [Pseudomonas sp. C1C7]